MTLTEAYNRWFNIHPLPDDDKHRLSQRFTVDYNYNSNHIEGNTLTYGQTELLLIFGKIIRIHPFEDGNGRIARLLVNYILARHNYPMIVVRSRNKQQYLDALSASDKVVGALPSKGANASLNEIRHFLLYFTNLVTEKINADVEFVVDKRPNVWWYDGEKVVFRTEAPGKIMSRLMLHPGSTLTELGNAASISERAVSKYLKNFTKKKYIQRREKYLIFITPSIY